jgi:2-dehydro-3-deoxygluconokinase
MKICCFGETLLRLSPIMDKKWIVQQQCQSYIGGAELNVATALALWNLPIRYCTALPNNYLSKDITEYIEQLQIDSSHILFTDGRLGIYYLPQGDDLKNSSVIYDRANSAFANLMPNTIDWQIVLKDCNWLHLSAISPALNENVATTCIEAVKIAKQLGVTVSIDLNYRNKLWQYGKAPSAVMKKILPYCDVVMGNIWAAESLLAIPTFLNGNSSNTQANLLEATGKSMLQLHQQYPNVQTMAYTFRLPNEYFAVLQNGSTMEVSTTIALPLIKEKVGSGDCFMAGLIYGLIKKMNNSTIINFAVAAAVTKMDVLGDATTKTVKDIKTFLQNKIV